MQRATAHVDTNRVQYQPGELLVRLEQGMEPSGGKSSGQVKALTNDS
jgi:hypothetical protein